jgi:hypothetical protein
LKLVRDPVVESRQYPVVPFPGPRTLTALGTIEAPLWGLHDAESTTDLA